MIFFEIFFDIFWLLCYYLPMLALERQKYIEKELKVSGSILISEMSAKLKCSEETIRRDLSELEKNQKLVRVHGGAYLPLDSDKGVPAKIKEILLPLEKQKIADITVKKFINENDTIFIDSSTTCLTLARKIIDLNLSVTIITNSLLIFEYFCDNSCENVKLIGLGGNYRQRACSFVGYDTSETIKKYSADKCFLSPSAVSYDHGILDNSSNECEIRKSFIKQSQQHILLIDHTKLGDTANYVIASLDDLDFVVTDEIPEKKWLDILKTKKIELYY